MPTVPAPEELLSTDAAAQKFAEQVEKGELEILPHVKKELLRKTNPDDDYLFEVGICAPPVALVDFSHLGQVDQRRGGHLQQRHHFSVPTSAAEEVLRHRALRSRAHQSLGEIPRKLLRGR